MSGFIMGLAVGVGLSELACQYLADFSIVRATWDVLKRQK